jgi:hypothetical protein
MSKKPKPVDAQYITIPWMREQAVPITTLQRDPANERAHDRANVDAIKGSIRRFGIMEPIGVRLGVVIRGNGTLTALEELAEEKAPALPPLRDAIGDGPQPWDHAPIVNLDHLSETDAAAWRITHNRTAELGKWDWAKLQETLRDQADVEWTGLGWEPAELDLLLQASWTPPALESTEEAASTTEVSTGPAPKTLMIKLDGELADRMRALAEEQDVSPAELLAAWIEIEASAEEPEA